jgi:hypothetical protein
LVWALTNEIPSIPMLPLRKEERPALIALDSNAWIELSKANLGVQKDDRWARALAELRSAVRTGVAVIPAFGIPLAEACFARHEGRRRLLAFILDLSENRSVVQERIVTVRELLAAVAHLVFGAGEASAIRPELLRYGTLAAIGDLSGSIAESNPELAQRVVSELGPEAGAHAAVYMKRALLHPELGLEMLDRMASPESAQRIRDLDRAGFERLTGIRTMRPRMPFAEARLAEARDSLTGIVASMYFRETGIARDEVLAWLERPGNLEVLVEATPSVDVLATLLAEHARNPELPLKDNDYRDLTFFEVAVPHANIVISEKMWSSLAASSGLARKYGTAVLHARRLHELPALLGTVGSAR